MILKIIEGETDADIRTQARELLVKQLKQTGWFEKLDSELDVWLEHSSKLDSVEFLEKILSTLFSNPYPYLDTVCQVVTGVSEHKKQGRTIDNKPLPFSPLVPIALKHSEEVDQSDDIWSYVHTCLSAILLRQDNPLPLASLLSTHRKSGLSLVSDVILGTKKAKVGKCSLGPEGDMWELFFLLDWGSRDAAKLREAVLKQVEQQTSAVEQETACHYCLLALWHCQETGKEEEMTSYVGDLLLTIRDSVLVAEKLIQSGVVLKWYMGDDSESSTFYHITKLCNSVLERINTSQIKELKAQTEIFRTRLLSKLRNVEKHDDKLTLLILRSTTIFAPAFSSADLLHVLNFLIGTEAALLETYSTCLEVCVQTFTSRPVTTSAEIAQRLSIIDSLVKMESGYKYKMLLIALTNTCAPDVIYFHVWAECLQTADSDDADAAAASDLLVYLIRESVTDDFVLRLLPLLNKSQTDKLLPVVHEIIGRVSDDSTVKHFASLWKPLANKLKGFDGSSHCEQAATVLSHLAPHVKEKNVMNLANSLLSSEGLLAAQPLITLLLRLSKHHPKLYVQIFSLVNDNMSKLTFQAVELIGKELSAISMPENTQVEIKQLIAGRWKELIFSALRKNYDSESWLRLVTTLTRIVYGTTAKPVEMNLSPSDMFQLLTNHSKFLPVVMCNHATSSLLSKAKGELLTLLTLLVELSPSICSADHYPIWLSAYQATMSTNDRKLLRLMYLYETSGVSTLKYSIKQNVTPSLISQPSVDIVLESLDKELLRQSAYNLPLQRALSHQQDSPSSATESHDFDEKLYDPAFLLPLFAYIMRPDNTLDTRQLVGDGIITYIICCLTSHVEDVRAAARFILYEFRQHLESSVYSESVQGLYILDLLKESIQLENARISPIIAVFIAKTLQNIPDEHMYKVCHNYLLIKPRMNLDSVPEFFRLFYSSSQEFAVERSWMLQLLLTSLREDSDFRMYEKLNIFKAIMAYGQCQLCSSDDRVVILEVITKSCTLSTAYQTVIKYNILGWLSSMIISFPQVAMPALKCFHAMVSRQLTEKSWFEVFCTQLVTTLISIMKRVRITEVEGSLFTEILYRSLAMRRTVRLKNFSSSESVEGLAAVAPVSPCESEAIVRYLPRVNSDYELKVLRLAHVQSTSS
ncbi:hypothetical protein EB796_000032 [Bugula neritina]|uniref:URB1 C-terminal domain-containing protein n=1 Tax=Bugula neritina TaxID=10212 RepID=A0A7J7KU34_BUGNE|nr:hypothetical protein EB796_000032 [Bugula neritina]